MPRGSQTQDSFFRGILQRKSPKKRDAGWVDEALNVSFRGGVITSRPGIRPWGGAPLGFPSRGLGFHITGAGVRQLLVAAGTGIYRWPQGGDPILLPMTGLPAAEQTRSVPSIVNFFQLSGGANLTFIYDALNQNLKWDGTLLSRMGIDTPSAITAPDVTYGAGLITAGSHLVYRSLYSGQHESDLSPEFEITNATAYSVTIDPPTTLDPQVTKWRAYMTQIGKGKVFFAGEADIGSPLTISISDAVLQANDPAERLVNRPPPAPARSLLEHRGQLAGVFTDEPSLVRFSNIDPDFMVPEGWPRANVVPIAPGDGDIIRAMASFHEWLLVFKENSTWAIVGEGFESYRPVPVLAAGGGHHLGLGCYAPGAVLQTDNELMFVARDGIYRIDRFASASGGVEATRLTSSIDDLYAAAKFSLGAAASFDRKKRSFTFWGHG